METSISVVIGTHSWLAAKKNIENIGIDIISINISAAFGLMNRQILLNFPKDIVKEGELYPAIYV